MSRWKDEFEAHPIHQTLLSVRKCLDTEVVEPSSSLIAEKRRLLKILDLIDEALSGLDPEVVPSTILNGINSHMTQQNFWNQVNAFKANADASHLTNANAQIDSLLPTIYQLFGLQRNKASIKLNKSTEKSFEDFTNTVDLKSGELTESVNNLKIELAATSKKQATLNTQMDQLASEHAAKVTEWGVEFSNQQDARTEASEKLEASREEIFNEWFDTFKSENDGKAKQTIANSQKQLTDHFEGYQSTTEELLTDAQKRHTQILELHGLVAGDGVVAGYVNNAESEKQAANFWRWAAFAFIGATAAWLAYAYNADVSPVSDATTILGRMAKIVPLTAIFLYGAVYASKQSSFHRNNEKQTRWFALEVKAIDPFIASLDDEQQKQLKEKLTERIFGRNDNSQGLSVANVDPNLLKMILDAMKDVAKSK